MPEELFWAALGALAQAVEALVVLASAFVIIYQVRQMRRESLENRVSGLKMAYEILESDELEKATDAVLSGDSVRGVRWRSVLEQLNLVGLLVKEGYTERGLLLRLKGTELAALDECIRRDAPDSLRSAPIYRLARDLLESAREYTIEHR